MKTKLLIAALTAGAVVTGLLVAQAPLPPRPEAAPTQPDFTGGTTRVQLPVIVRDKNGNFVNGLAEKDFEVIDEGVRQVVALDVAVHPVSVVVAVQSNSTAAQILPTIVKSASLFGPLIAGETGEVAVIGFDHRVQVHTDFTSDPDAIKAGFAKLRAGTEPSHLDDAAMEAVNMLRLRGKDRKKVLILVSETRDVQSSVSPRDVLTKAEFADVQIYAVEMNHYLNQFTAKKEPNRPKAIPPENRNPLPMGMQQTGTTDAQTNMGNWTPVFKEVFDLVKGVFVPNSLEVYTRFTGGREQSFINQGGLENAVRRISEELHSQYLLTFSPFSRKGGYHEITVNVTKAANLEVNTRRGFWIAPRGPDEQPAKR
jgi:VWFA-related protein